MAIFHPSDPPTEAPSSELKVRLALTELDELWHVFHQVRWQSVRSGRQGDGEADFVLLHPAHGLIVLEVKGGRVSLSDGRWVTIDRSDSVITIKDPFKQAIDSKFALFSFLKGLRGLDLRVRICHAVVFPDTGVLGPLGLHPREIIVDASEIPRVDESVARIVRHWDQRISPPLSGSEMEAVVTGLAPTKIAHRVLRRDVFEAESRLVELTNQQATVLQASRRLRECLIVGGAGTGKTLLAMAKARQLAREGARVLVLCYNNLLASRLSASVHDAPGITVRTFHALCLEWCRKGGVAVPQQLNNDWWQMHAATALEVASASEKIPPYDALMVDEAQDFEPAWLRAVRKLVWLEHGITYLFADEKQKIFGNEFLAPPGWPSLVLDINCRNTKPIATAVATTIGEPGPEKGAPGRAVSFVPASRTDIDSIVRDVVDRMIVEEGISAEHITVLTETPNLRDRLLRLSMTTANFAPPDSPGVTVETIGRFKGLESQIVVLALEGGGNDDRLRSIGYVGMSRARSFLLVVGPALVKRLVGLR